MEAADHCFSARRALFRDIFRETLESIDVGKSFRAAVGLKNNSLHIADLRYELSDYRRLLIIAVGKAAVPSVEAVLSQLSPCSIAVEAIVVGTDTLSATSGNVAWWQGSHPVPDANARDAALHIVKILRQTNERDLVLFLISGGASAMVELPLDPAITAQDVASFYRALVHSGLKIEEINTLRKHASAIKGGRLAALASAATKCTLLISDVPEGNLDVVGSGPTLPDASTREQCWELMRRPGLADCFPVSVRRLLESTALPETPKPDALCFRNAAVRVLLSTETMLAAAAESCSRHGFHAVTDNTCDDWDYRAAADYLLDKINRLSREHPRVCLLSGGEVLVKLDGEAGCGGRNQQFALYCATRLHAAGAQFTVLSAGTDGIDGNSPAAGAVVDCTTVERAREAGMEAQQALDGFDAYPLLEHIGDAIVTGPTGNNVRDLRILLAERA